MKNLIISIAAVALLIGSWLIFYSYSSGCIDDYVSVIEKDIIPEVEAESWDEAYRLMEGLSDQWHSYKKTALLFLDTQTVNEIDYSMARSLKYIKAKDVSNSSGELNSTVEQLTFLKQNDEVTAANIL